MKDTEDQHLRERCLDLAADVFKGSGVTAKQLTTVAEYFFQYIKNGGDTECYANDEPTPPVNTGPGMAVLRDVSNTRAALRRGEIFPS